MSDLNSWEDDPAAQDDQLIRQTQQQMNLGNNQQGQQGGFRPGAASFQPTASTFQPGQAYGGAGYMPQYQQQYYGGQGYYSQYGGGQGYDQYSQQQGYGNVYGQQGGYNQAGIGQIQQDVQQQQQPQTQQKQIYQPPLKAQQQASKPALSISKKPVEPLAAAAVKPAVSNEGGTKVLSIGGDNPKAAASKEGGAKVFSIGGDAPKPKTKLLSVGGAASAAKDEPKKEETKKDTTTGAAAKVAAAKAIEKTDTKASGSGKSSPSPSSGRSSPSRGGKGVGRDVDVVEKGQTADVDQETLKEIYGKEHVNIIFIGHVDAGKSTLGGAILVCTGMVDQRTLEKYKKESKEMGRETWYLSWALDLTNEERSKGKTVEVGRGVFETEKRRYSILDAPGHKTYVANMIGGAAQADVGILVISARKGEFETGFEKGGQTREHAMLAKTQGVNRLVVVINKMDDATVEWSEERYKECVTKLSTFLKGTGYNLKTDVTFMPIAAQQLLGIKDKVSKSVCAWWKEGPSLLEYLDSMKALERKVSAPFMMPVFGKYRDMGTVVEGKIEAGVVRKGMSLVMMPNKHNVEIAALYGETEDELTGLALCGDQVRMRLRGIEEDEITPGFILCSPKRLVKCVRTFEAQIRILDLPSILTAGFNCVLHVHAAIEEVTFGALLHKLQKGTNRKSKLPPTHAKKGDSIIARLEVIGGAGSVCVEKFEDYSQMGRFTLRDQGQTIAIGKIIKLIED